MCDRENDSKVLVHCKMGISRSAATVSWHGNHVASLCDNLSHPLPGYLLSSFMSQTISYTMKEYRMSLDDAYMLVKERRSCVRPNTGFMAQLKAYEGILKAR